MKKSLTFLLLVLFSYTLFAQRPYSLGIRGGGGIGNYNYGIINEFRVSKHLSIQLEINYSQKTRLTTAIALDDVGNAVDYRVVKIKGAHLQHPIMLKYKTSGKIKFYAMGGIAPFIGLSSIAYSGDSEFSCIRFYNNNDPLFFQGKADSSLYLTTPNFYFINQKSNRSVDLSSFANKIGNDFIVVIGFEKPIKKITPFIEARFTGRSTHSYSKFEGATSFSICGGLKFW